MLGCEQADKPVDTKSNQEVQLVEKDENVGPPLKVEFGQAENHEAFKTIEWFDLIPPEDLNALLNPPEYLGNIQDGSMEDQIASTMQSAMMGNNEDGGAYEAALVSTSIIESADGDKVRIPGFVVPVEYRDEQVIKSFFLVPYFGACLHMPPPPPNQIIYVETEQGIIIDGLYDAVWVSGTLATELFEDQIATSAYTMKMSHIELYYEL